METKTMWHKLNTKKTDKGKGLNVFFVKKEGTLAHGWRSEWKGRST